MRKIKEIHIAESCFNKALPYELIFVLLGRDVAAPAAIRAWVAERLRLGKNVTGDAQIGEALGLASMMEIEGKESISGTPGKQHTDYHRALAISEVPAVDECLRAFKENGDEDGAVALVQAILASQQLGAIDPVTRTGVWYIAQERIRQVTVEGWDAAHDAEHAPGELAIAGACYALEGATALTHHFLTAMWPWGKEWWKPKTPMRNLARAGALIAAEIDNRLASGEKP